MLAESGTSGQHVQPAIMPPLFPCHILCSLASFKEPEGQAAGSCSRAAQRRLSGATRGLWPISFTCYCGLQSCSCESNCCVCVYRTQMVFTGATEVAATKKKCANYIYIFPVCRWLFSAWSSWFFTECRKDHQMTRFRYKTQVMLQGCREE